MEMAQDVNDAHFIGEKNRVVADLTIYTLQVRDEWKMAAVPPIEDIIDSKYLEGHTQCVYGLTGPQGSALSKSSPN